MAIQILEPFSSATGERFMMCVDWCLLSLCTRSRCNLVRVCCCYARVLLCTLGHGTAE